jgi:diaminopimelate epimerase
MNDVGPFEIASGRAVLDTGSPHLVLFVGDANAVDVVAEGRRIRYGDAWREQGVNVNFVSKLDGALSIRTYERGVEDETLSCGTGAVAAALAAAANGWIDGGLCLLVTRGGELTVRVTPAGGGVRDICREGPARHVFDGETSL